MPPMKISTRVNVLLVALVFIAAGCSGDSGRYSTSSLSDEELVSTIIEIYAEPDRIERTDQLVSVLKGVKPDQGEALGQALDGLDLEHREPEWILIVAAWSKFDGEAATRWTLRQSRLEWVRFLMLNESIYHWALDDAEGLIRDPQMVAYSRNGWDKFSMRGIVRGWYDSGKPNLEQWVYDLPPTRGDDRQRAASALIASKLADVGVEETIDWARSTMQGYSPFNRYIYSRLAGDIAKIDPERAIAWCEEICDTKLGAEVPLWIATTWVVDGRGDAMEWITKRDAEVTSVRVGARAAYRRFLLNHQLEALEWMESLPEEERTGRAALQGPLFMYVNEKSGLGEFETAIEWTNYMVKDSTREESLKTIGRRWLRQDPEAAEAWLATAPMSEDAKMKARLPKPDPSERRKGFRAKETLLSPE